MAAASVAQNWTTEQPQSSSRISKSRVSFSHAYPHYNKSDHNTNHYGFSRNGSIPIPNRPQDNRYSTTRPLLRVNLRSASAINMNHIYMQHHRPYASVFSPGYLRKELQRSIHSKEHPLIPSIHSLHHVYRRSSGKYPLDKRLGVTHSNKNHEKSFSNAPISSIYNTNSHVSNETFQTEDTRILHYSTKINNTQALPKLSKNAEQDFFIPFTNNNKDVPSHSFNENIEPNISNDSSKIRSLEANTISEHNGNFFVPETSNNEHNVTQNNQPSQTKSLKAKILKVLSFSSLPALETISTNNPDHIKSHTYTQNTLNNTTQSSNIDINSDIYSFSKKTASSDNVSISSTASSASIMLRKISKEGKGMLKKSKKTLSNILRNSLHFENTNAAISKECKKNIIEDISKASVKIESIQDSFQVNTKNFEITENDNNNLLTVNLDNHAEEQSKSIYQEKDDSESKLTYENISVNTTSTNDPIKENEEDQPTYFKPFPNTKKGILKCITPNCYNFLTGLDTDWSSTASNFKSSHSLTDLTIQFTPPTPLELVTFNDVPNALSAETSITKNTKSLSFSPKITIYDTWPSFEYDRRGEIATCNRLTPILAQRIKEELNTYKLDEMVAISNLIFYITYFRLYMNRVEDLPIFLTD
ncbi:uncharacterized protein T551_00207 [Pneumocystis jirovecii RU7]|uniref:Uncharacterized protein n=1 Tax=Pneumocystis jirovecii (strain RU7) TaxID=1408657 RepID=A0A0W4ZWG4_PNEJ7|nr:uncharacterized protein T551_00207 [Pneumocystis jirovecii RU7]KTW32722.1 hypothetical protein T551_00207 [Pneumocystis jirovecii RU7]